ncbi:MAG TPA: VOC family protein [bacterium]|nr:VOC family protein [bacterium]
MAGLLVNIDVDDLQRGVAFYTEALGLHVGRRFGAVAVELLGSPAPIYLLAKAPGSEPFTGAPAPRDYGPHWTPVHLDFAVNDLEAALHRAEAVGATREGGIAERAWGRLALLRDPFGHGLCLLQFSAQGYDAVATT